MMTKHHNPQNHKRGIALILVISSLAMLSIMMVEFTFGSQMNLRISNNFRNALKAKHLAESGIHFALIELKIYKKIREHPALKQIPGFNEGMLDMIWKFGFIYPPIATKQSSFGKESQIEELVEKSKIDGTIHVEIFDESTKINLNDLEKNELRPGITQQLTSIINRKKLSDEAFYDQYRNLNVEELLNNIVDWIDKDRIRIGGGDEESYYGRLKSPYKPKNAPMSTLSELALVEGFDDKLIFNLLKPFITVYPTGGINVNTADEETLLTLSPELTEEDVKKIVERRQTAGYFKSAKEFEDFCKTTLLKSGNFNQTPKVALSTRSTVFSLVSTAEVGGAQQTIRSVVTLDTELPSGSPQILYWTIH